MERVICLLIGYVFGLFQTGYIVGKIKHIDIRLSLIHILSKSRWTWARRHMNLKTSSPLYL